MYGFAVSIDWETHQLLSKTELSFIFVQWRATPSGSFREPVDYKGQEHSNLVFSEFRRSFRTAKLFFVSIPEPIYKEKGVPRCT